MPTICKYVRPNKPKKRFGICDAVRVARAVAKNNDRDAIIASIGFNLGYVRLIDGSKLTESELKRRIMEVMRVTGTIEDVLGQVPVFSRLGITIRIITTFASQFAFLAASLAIIVINQETIVGAIRCGRENV